jgi:hypothetical protein
MVDLTALRMAPDNLMRRAWGVHSEPSGTDSILGG